MGMTFVGGLPQTRCGAGSTVEFTEGLRGELARLLRETGVRRIFDAPCGDFNWMAKVDLSGIEYVGMDYDEENIRLARSRSSHEFIHGDILTDPWPSTDLILCRDFLQHLPNYDVMSMLARVRWYGIRWMLATSHTNDRNEDIQKPGDFRPLNLCARPFNLSEPDRALIDGPARILGLWSLH